MRIKSLALAEVDLVPSLARDQERDAKLPLRFPHRESVWKSRRHLLPKERAPIVFADPAARPRQPKVERRAYVGGAGGAAR